MGEWFGKLKCSAMLFSLLILMTLSCVLNLFLSVCEVSPTYCLPHVLLVITYTIYHDWQVNLPCIL